MKRMLVKAVVAGVFCMAGQAHAQSCAGVITDLINWTAQSNGNTTYFVGATITSNKAPAKFVSSGEAAFFKNGNSLRATQINTVFSDRRWCPELGAGMFCTNYQEFDYRHADKWTVELFPNSTGKITLNSWGNTQLPVTLQCLGSFLYGVVSEGNGRSIVTISTNKLSLAIPK